MWARAHLHPKNSLGEARLGGLGRVTHGEGRRTECSGVLRGRDRGVMCGGKRATGGWCGWGRRRATEAAGGRGEVVVERCGAAPDGLNSRWGAIFSRPKRGGAVAVTAAPATAATAARADRSMFPRIGWTRGGTRGQGRGPGPGAHGGKQRCTSERARVCGPRPDHQCVGTRRMAAPVASGTVPRVEIRGYFSARGPARGGAIRRLAAHATEHPPW